MSFTIFEFLEPFKKAGLTWRKLSPKALEYDPWVDNKNYFGIDYPINCEKLAELISNVIGKKVGGVKLLSWEEVARQVGELCEKELS